ncbi:hypothetical protein HS088_TW12G00683 [Tripterygium wilfordii]|uniref:Exocyst subunit Exo70 family protein n=1 Tax=Tripterygium wilfordii TaxID=458696 RepID=A0A7J7CZG3_TRIWF|nr:exocyst complex component EXO70I-like [Tripterygium wilfordii]KAF5739477.1 hypothetical protein HS088_TW12G00683 [Tripterygium wilfordii]
MAPNEEEEDPTIIKLESARSSIKILLQNSAEMEESLERMDKDFDRIAESLSTSSRRVAPLHSLSITTKALETRINRSVSPALSLLDNFKLCESLQSKLLDLSSKLSAEKKRKRRLKNLLSYVDCVDQLNSVIEVISRDGEPVTQRLQEVVEFLSRTKATDQYNTHRLRETLVTLKALYETEVDAMKFDGLLDEALLSLQDEYESILQKLRHQDTTDDFNANSEAEMAASDLGTELEVAVLRKISETLAANDCLDICIDIYVKVRYRRAAKALMQLNPDYLRTYTPEEIDEMEWETLETAIGFWVQHFELAVKTVLVSEKKLSNQILGGIFDGVIWPECFVKIADKIMAVFLRFGEGVARSSKEPQKLFKLLDMFTLLEKLKTEFTEIFEGEAGADICTRFRELEKLLVHASTKVFWEFGLQIEGNSDGLPLPANASVPKLVRYAINFLKYLATETYSASMAKVLQTEQIWKAGILSKPETSESLLKDAVLNIMEALQRNVEAKKSRYKDKVLPHVFAMNTYWYIYMRSKNTELGRLIGEQYMKKKYKIVAEEAAYMYQRQAWGPLVGLLDKEEMKRRSISADIKAVARGNIESFLKELEEISKKHIESIIIPDVDLRDQIKEATTKLVVSTYTEFLNYYSKILPVKSYTSPETIQEFLGQIFSGGDRVVDGRLRRLGSKDLIRGETSASMERDVKAFRRTRSNRSNTSDL